jgi:hypothetical protein
MQGWYLPHISHGPVFHRETPLSPLQGVCRVVRHQGFNFPGREDGKASALSGSNWFEAVEGRVSWQMALG